MRLTTRPNRAERRLAKAERQTLTAKDKVRRAVWILCSLLVFLYLFGPRFRNAARIARRTSPNFEDRPKSDELVKAAGSGDVKTMQRLLDAGVSPNAGSSGSEGVSALSAAAGNDPIPAVNLLLSRGADVNADDFWGGNALVGASLWGTVDVVRILIARGADPNMDDDGATALGYASHQLLFHDTKAPIQNYRAIVGILESNGGDSDLFDRPIARIISLFN